MEGTEHVTWVQRKAEANRVSTKQKQLRSPRGEIWLKRAWQLRVLVDHPTLQTEPEDKFQALQNLTSTALLKQS